MSEYTVIGMMYTAFQTAMLACIRYWLYQNNLRVSAKRMYVIVFIIAVGGTGFWVMAGGINGLSFGYFRMAIAAGMYILSCFIIKEPLLKHTYVYSFIMVYDSTLEISAFFVQGRFMPGVRGWLFALTAALILALTFIPAVRYLKRMIARLSAAGSDKLWGWLCVISFSFVFMDLLFTFPLTAPPVWRELLSRYLMMTGIIGLYAATTRAVETMREAAEAKSELGLTKKRIDMQETYYERLVSQMEEVRRMRHDMRHHRAVLSTLVKNGKTEELSSYLESMKGSEERVTVTGNLAVDSILLYYMDAARQVDSVIETELSFSKKMPVSDSDLCVILGNLLENAVDAQRGVDPEKRYICVRAVSSETRLTLAVDNRYNGVLGIDEKGDYISRKSGEGHGLGIGSVRIICRKYGGILQIETEGDLFMAGVVIGL